MSNNNSNYLKKLPSIKSSFNPSVLSYMTNNKSPIKTRPQCEYLQSDMSIEQPNKYKISSNGRG